MEKEKNLNLEKSCIVCGADCDNYMEMNDIYDNEQIVCTECFVQGLKHINEENKKSTLFTIKEYERVTGVLIKEISMRNSVQNDMSLSSN